MSAFTFLARTAAKNGQTRRAAVVLGLTLLAIVSAFGMLLRGARDDERVKASIMVANISAALSQNLSRTIAIYDQSLQGLIADYAKPAVMGADPALRQMVLFNRFAVAPSLQSVLILDDKGTPLFSSVPSHLHAGNYADRGYFKAHAADPGLGLFISEPIRAYSDGRWVISLSRRYNKPDGSFGGLVSATLRLDDIHRMFAQMSLGASKAVTLYRNDGVLLMREPFDEAMLGQTIHPPRLLRELARAPEGEYEGLSPVDKVERLTHYQTVGTSTLVQMVGLATSDIYAGWWRKAVQVGLILLVACIAMVSLAAILQRELRRRTEAEATLAALASQDPLTKLANRRAFDTALTRHMDQACSLGAAVSLLMIDADHFKAYNDTFGHPAGDAVLVAIGDVLAHHAHRPDDLAVRYGGEEFAVILPRTGATEAMRVAEAIRADVAALALAGPNPGHVVTVSIGVASRFSQGHIDGPRLLHMADTALYSAKASGRNRAVLCPGSVVRGHLRHRAA